MHDIKFIRENPDAFRTGLEHRFVEDAAGVTKKALALDEQLRAAVTSKQQAETARNAASKQIGQAKAKGDDAEFERLRAEVGRLKDEMETHGAAEETARAGLKSILEALPNLALEGVPVGPGEEDNVEQSTWGTPREFDFAPKDHVDVGEGLGELDFERAAAMSGARFAILKGGLARLERALGQFMLDLQVEEHGYAEVSPPYLVRGEALYGTSQLPKFEDDLFKTNGDHYLIPTAEVPLTNIVREQITDGADLPLRFTALTPSFRAEAGSAGRDTRGLIRMHQFHKVELVSIVAPQEAEAEHERMTACAEKVLQLLELPYRRMLLSSGDMGFAARRTYDLEVWLPSQDTYREISSCSDCGDFQARRMDARFRREGSKKPEYVITLNGSGLAVGRTLVAILENHQNADGSVTIPGVLQPYMRGMDRLEPST